MKFFNAVAVILAATFFFAACANEKKIPNRVAVLSTAGLDIIDSLGLSEKIVGVSENTTQLDYLKKFGDDKKILEVDEKDPSSIIKCQPDLILIDDTIEHIDRFEKVAPVVIMQTQLIDLNVVESNSNKIATIFERENIVEDIFTKFRARIDESKSKIESKKVFITREKFNGIAENFGLEPVKLDQDPDYIFVIDRNDMLSLDFDVLKNTTAAENNRVIYSEYSDEWIFGSGGIHALDLMLQDFERNL